MKYSKSIIVAGILFVFTFLSSCEKKTDLIILLTHEVQKELFINIIERNNYTVNIVDNGSHLIIKNIPLEVLLEVYYVLRIKKDVINDNIANEKTTRTINGGPYTRKYAEYTVQNGLVIVEDQRNYHRFSYDPIHPDSIKNGELEGYVKYPNVDVVTEMVDLLAVKRSIDSIEEYIKNNYKNVIIF